MSKPSSAELSRAVMQLQVKMMETTKQIQIIDNQIVIIKRALHHSDIARQEIGILPHDTKAYKSVGRMFLLTDLTQVKTNLDEKISALTSRAAELENNKKILEKTLKESEENIKEILKQQRELNQNNST